MNYSTQYIAVIVNLLVVILPLLGITVESQQLETTIQTIVAVLSGLWIMYQRTTLVKANKGDVNALGVRI